MTIEVISDEAGFARLEPAWRALEISPRTAGLFRGYTWQFEWWRALGGGRALRILVDRGAGGIRGILPLYLEHHAGIRRLAFLGSAGGGSDYLDVVTPDASIRASLLERALAMEADLLELDDIELSSPLVGAATNQAHARHFRCRTESRYPCPYIPIEGAFRDYRDRVARQDTLKRRQKWFAAQPGFRIACETAPEHVPAFLDRFFRLHAARWRIDGGSQAFADPRLIAFHRAVTSRLAYEGAVRMWTLWVAGEAVAVAYSFEEGRRSLYYQSGFLPAWASRSAGLVLFARYVEDAFERGCEEVDLLRGSEPYKAEWTQMTRSTVSIRIALTSRGRAALVRREARQRVRELLRDSLPPAVRLQLTQVVRERRMREAA
jgi:CelD/BcsL family acetyltransferase involved in cellulose biosynthesis